MNNVSRKKTLLAIPYIFWMIAFTIIPLMIIGYYGFVDQAKNFTLSNFLAIKDFINLRALIISLRIAFISTIFCLLLAYPLAMILKSKNMNRGSFIVFIFILPMWMNFLLRTYAWQTLLEQDGVLNTILSTLRLPKQHLINTEGAIILGMVYNFLPFMVLPIYNVLIKIDSNTINAATDLGANPFQTFWRIIIPLSFPGIVSGITMVFVPALTTFVISSLLGGGKILLIGNIIEQQFTVSYNWNLGAGLSFALMVFVLISMALLNKYDKNGEGTAF